jgi:hypothetical protein
MLPWSMGGHRARHGTIRSMLGGASVKNKQVILFSSGARHDDRLT